MNDYKLRKGDFISIHWLGEDERHPGFAYDLRYIGRNREHGYVLESTIYGWRYIVDKDKATVCCEGYGMNRIYPVDNRSGWANYLPD